MTVRLRWVWVALGLWACGQHSERSGSPSPDDVRATAAPQGPGSTYDVAPMLASVRPALHEALRQALAPRSPSTLPLYDMDVDLDLGSARFTVHQLLWWTNNETGPIDRLAFRLYANTAATLTGKNPPMRFSKGRCPEDAGCVIEQPRPDVITVKPSQPIAPGDRLRVELDVDGTLSRIDSSRTNMLAQGLEGMASMGSPHGHGDYGLLAIGDGIASLANFHPMLARRAHGRWIEGDENLLGDLGSDELCHMRARVTLDPGVELVSAGVITERGVSASGRTQLTVVAGAVREMALLASRQLRSTRTMVGDVLVTSHYLPMDAAEGVRALEIAKHALQIFERRFGQYPYTELDVVEAAMVGGAGGVEFSGLVTVASMLYRPMAAGSGALGGLLQGMNGAATANADQLRSAMFELVVAHEVAHQYWHVLVGSDSREHPFNDEGLAQHSAIVYLEDRYGRERAQRDEDMQVANGYRMMRAMGHPDGPVDRPVSAFGAPIEYAGLVYGKGPMVYRALRDQTGEDGFFEAVRSYVKAYRFRTAPRAALIDTIAARGRALQVRRIAQRWLDESHGDEDLGALDLATVTGQAADNGVGLPGGIDLQRLLPLLGGMAPQAAATPPATAAGSAPPTAVDLGQVQGAAPDAENDGRNDWRYGVRRPLRTSGMFGDDATDGRNGPTSDPELNQVLKMMPPGTGDPGQSPDLGQLMQQLQRLSPPPAEPSP